MAKVKKKENTVNANQTCLVWYFRLLRCAGKSSGDSIAPGPAGLICLVVFNDQSDCVVLKVILLVWFGEWREGYRSSLP